MPSPAKQRPFQKAEWLFYFITSQVIVCAPDLEDYEHEHGATFARVKSIAVI
jgi:hypothetical protein